LDAGDLRSFEAGLPGFTATTLLFLDEVTVFPAEEAGLAFLTVAAVFLTAAGLLLVEDLVLFAAAKDFVFDLPLATADILDFDDLYRFNSDSYFWINSSFSVIT